jgi:hypothetical protein
MGFAGSRPHPVFLPSVIGKGEEEDRHELGREFRGVQPYEPLVLAARRPRVQERPNAVGCSAHLGQVHAGAGPPANLGSPFPSNGPVVGPVAGP